MQPLDPADPRRPYVQIAAAIRADILNGDLAAGTQLPSVDELAKFFGVAKMTVHRAMRDLQDENLVTVRAGSGTFVKDRAEQPVPAGEGHALAGSAAFLFEMGHLKHTTRTGWLLLGIPLPETVAEHSFRAGIVGMMLAALEGADVAHTGALCLLHDSHETRIGDVPSVGRAYITTPPPEAISRDQTSAIPDVIAKPFQELKAEFEAGETLEARVAKDADKIETLLQAAEYAAQGHDTRPWQRTSIEALRTNSGRELARAITAADPRAWWERHQKSYHELRASAQKRSRG